MKIFCTGATGFIGGSVTTRLIAAGHRVMALVRTGESAQDLRRRGAEPVIGTLDDVAVLMTAAADADVVVNMANADHPGAAAALLKALDGTGKTFLHTSGSGIVGTRSNGLPTDTVFDEQTPFTPAPSRAARVAIDAKVRAAKDRKIRTVIICPSMIYGLGTGPRLHSSQVPALIALAKKHGIAKHIGPGRNIWSNVHIDDVVSLYMLALERAPAGAFYFAENGENSIVEICQAISRMLGFGGQTATMTIEAAVAEWGEKLAADSLGSNSRVRAVRARTELGWTPSGLPLLEEIERGCYAQTLH